MARHKNIDTQPRFLEVNLSRQLLLGTFEHALNHLLDHAIDLSHFDARFQNDATGAPADPPAFLLKVELPDLRGEPNYVLTHSFGFGVACVRLQTMQG